LTKLPSWVWWSTFSGTPCIWRENSGDSQTFKAEIGTFIFAWIFRTYWAKIVVLGK